MTTSDLPIPRVSAILDRACDALSSAYRLQDDRTAGQLERLIQNAPGASLRWSLGALIIHSTSGGVYRVTRAGCSCPNGRYCAKRACWHVALYELLADMLETDAETRDMAAYEAL